MRRLTGLSLVLLLFAACGGEDKPTITPLPTPQAIEGDVGITILRPTNGTTLPLGDVRVDVGFRGVELVNRIGEPPKKGEGHLIFYLDVDAVPTKPGKPALTSDKTSKAVAGGFHVWPDVKEGKHTFDVQLVNNDNTPFEPAKTARAVVTIASGAASQRPQASVVPAAEGKTQPAGDATVSIQAPGPDERIDGSTVKVSANVENFRLVDKIGQSARQGEGHVLYYIGQSYEVPTTKDRPATVGGSGSFTTAPAPEASYEWMSVSPGTYKLSVQLVSSDNTPLDPPQVAAVTVRVG